MNGAFHGRDHDGRTGGHAQHRVVRAVRRPAARFVAFGEVGVGAEVSRAATRSRAARRLSSSIAMSRHSTMASRSTSSSMRSARRRRYVPRSVARRARPTRGRRRAAARDGQVGLERRRRATTSASLSDQSSGERSSKVVADATRSLLMKWPVATSTPPTLTRVLRS